MKKRAILILALLLVSVSLFAGGVGVEFNLAWPFVPGVNIYAAKVLFPVWDAGSFKGEVRTGLIY